MSATEYNINNFEIDELQMYMGDDYQVNQKIAIHQPTIGEIIKFGEKKYFNMVYTICAIPSDMKPQLWDAGIDYEEISDFDLFIMLTRDLPKESTYLLLGDLDLQSMKIGENIENGNQALVDYEKDIVIDQFTYLKIINYIRKMHGIVPKVEHAYNQYTKKLLIEDDRMRLRMRQNKEYRSILRPLISSMVNSAGFKYKKNELREVGLVEFMDSVSRISCIQSATALLHGCYSGMIDTSKINKEELNWLKEL